MTTLWLRSRAVRLATDGAPSMIGKMAGVVVKFKEKVQAANGGDCFWTFHCILHQEALCCKLLKVDHVMEVVVRTVNFIRARGLNHRQSHRLLSDNNISHGLPCHTEVRWLSQGAVLKHFFDLMRKSDSTWRKNINLLWNNNVHNGCIYDLAFMVDITEHLNNLNKMLQGCKKIVTSIMTAYVHSNWSSHCGRRSLQVVTLLISPV